MLYGGHGILIVFYPLRAIFQVEETILDVVEV